MLQLRNNEPLFVQLASEFDSTRLESFSKSELFRENNRPYGSCYFEVKDINTARELCLKFIQYFDLSSSNWSGGRVVDKNNNFIIQISYNGSMWDNENWKIAKEV